MYPICILFLNGALTAMPTPTLDIKFWGILYVKDRKLAIEKTTSAYIY